MHPSTCKNDTHKLEYVLKNRAGRYAAVQVKQGHTPIKVAEYENFDGDVYLFQTEGVYDGTPAKLSTNLILLFLERKKISRLVTGGGRQLGDARGSARCGNERQATGCPYQCRRKAN